MIKIPSHISTPLPRSLKSKNTVTPVEKPAPDKTVTDGVEPLMERRKNPDRRKHSRGRGMYEMRRGRGRRKEDRQDGIDTEA